ncbi:MAG: hypothetical protein CSA44_01740 [Gammaproteobacteria bacterium]|nr:MAG: hypothetical protein CSA44_01740 [Gammaproteobacteria bacterium]
MNVLVISDFPVDYLWLVYYHGQHFKRTGFIIVNKVIVLVTKSKKLNGTLRCAVSHFKATLNFLLLITN